MNGECALCEVCYYQYPTVEFHSDEVEHYLHGRVRRADEAVGIYRQAFVGRAGHSKLRSRSQDGGIVTALLAYALDSEVIEAAVVAGRDENWLARPIVATSSDDLVNSAGTKYTTSPTILGVRSAIDEYGKSRIGLVGTPCQIRAVRRIQTSPLRDVQLAEAMTLCIGLFCMESYTHDSLMLKYLNSKGVNSAAITKVEIKKGQFVVSSGETEVLRLPLKEINQFVRGSCHHCYDFTAEFSDVSVGGIGCPSGYSTIIARTQTGLDILNAAAKAGYLELQELKQDDKGFQTILKMTQLKKGKKSQHGTHAESEIIAKSPAH
jgi:coenzyme F420 hydrogenase subunit beta